MGLRSTRIVSIVEEELGAIVVSLEGVEAIRTLVALDDSSTHLFVYLPDIALSEVYDETHTSILIFSVRQILQAELPRTVGQGAHLEVVLHEGRARLLVLLVVDDIVIAEIDIIIAEIDIIIIITEIIRWLNRVEDILYVVRDVLRVGGGVYFGGLHDHHASRVIEELRPHTQDAATREVIDGDRLLLPISLGLAMRRICRIIEV